MGWGTRYKLNCTLKNILKDIRFRCSLAWKALTMKDVKYQYDGYINRVVASHIEYEIEELQGVNRMLWDEIIAYTVATPPAWAEDCEGEKYPYPEFITMEVRKKQEAIEENLYLIAHMQDCLEAQRENPENVISD